MTEAGMRKRVLLVDDDDAVVDSLTLALEDSYEVLAARNGREALEVLEGEGVDAVLLDLMMPVLDGPGFLRECRARHIEVPVLVFSAGIDVASRVGALGVDDYV
ncbi:MAG TPA: response regulator, partial [Polyangia bacterium]|nr:response regulator [Polyangia bacterium]